MVKASRKMSVSINLELSLEEAIWLCQYCEVGAEESIGPNDTENRANIICELEHILKNKGWS